MIGQISLKEVRLHNAALDPSTSLPFSFFLPFGSCSPLLRIRSSQYEIPPEAEFLHQDLSFSFFFIKTFVLGAIPSSSG